MQAGSRSRIAWPPQQESSAKKLAAWLAEGKDVYVYYNNDLDGHAVDNARQLQAAGGQLTQTGVT